MTKEATAGQEFSTEMTPEERRGAASLASIFGLRMMGLFLILPVFSTYAHGLDGALEKPYLVGIALGAYGLTQALLQIPFGMMSDRFGRKPVIAAGMLLFAFGSVIAAMASSIEGVLLGRVIQGSGAVAAAVIALAADLTRDEHRTKAMAMIGITIGVSFAISMVLGPLLNAWIGVAGIFWLTAVLALASILVLYLIVPDPKQTGHHSDSEVTVSMFGQILRHKSLLRLDAGVLILHASLTALFVVLPLVLADKRLNLLPMSDQWMLYLPVMLLSFVLMIPLIIVAEAKRKMKQVFIVSIAMLIAACVMLAMGHMSIVWIGVALLVFFTGFNTLEASLPSLVAKYAPAGAKGTAIGVFNTSQFFGAFVGGVLGGFMYHPALQNYAMVFWIVAGMLGIWLLIAISMQHPPYLASRSFHVNIDHEADVQDLEDKVLAVEGVVEALVIYEESALYCKVDSKILDEKNLYDVLRTKL
ncbi:MAG: MFS transporter [Mariprofundaceae bacterium]|nr:MFS transporter [Mariprofundaceae bacterium]